MTPEELLDKAERAACALRQHAESDSLALTYRLHMDELVNKLTMGKGVARDQRSDALADLAEVVAELARLCARPAVSGARGMALKDGLWNLDPDQETEQAESIPPHADRP